MSDHLSPKAQIAGYRNRAAQAEEAARLAHRDAEYQARERRRVEAECAALRTELGILRDSLNCKPGATVLEQLVREASAATMMSIAIRRHRQRYEDQGRSEMHHHDTELYDAFEAARARRTADPPKESPR